MLDSCKKEVNTLEADRQECFLHPVQLLEEHRLHISCIVVQWLPGGSKVHAVKKAANNLVVANSMVEVAQAQEVILEAEVGAVQVFPWPKGFNGVRLFQHATNQRQKKIFPQKWHGRQQEQAPKSPRKHASQSASRSSVSARGSMTGRNDKENKLSINWRMSWSQLSNHNFLWAMHQFAPPYVCAMLSLGLNFVPHSHPASAMHGCARACMAKFDELVRVLLWGVAFTKMEQPYSALDGLPYPTLCMKKYPESPHKLRKQISFETICIDNAPRLF